MNEEQKTWSRVPWSRKRQTEVLVSNPAVWFLVPRHKERAASQSTLAVETKKRAPLWPEWNDADVNGEKWEGGAAKAKEDKKAAHLFEDPDGKVDLPNSLRAHTWRRPSEFIVDKFPVVVETERECTELELISSNEAVHQSETLRWIISQIQALWTLNKIEGANGRPLTAFTEAVIENDNGWRPWEHIYANCKASKQAHVPLYNQSGKYVVKLHWMGCWRKIVVDDQIPFDEAGNILLPTSRLTHELWPMILSKALLKVLSLDGSPYKSTKTGREFGNCYIIECLTGWISEEVTLHSSVKDSLWSMLSQSIPRFKWPEMSPSPSIEQELEPPKDPAAEPTAQAPKDSSPPTLPKEASKVSIHSKEHPKDGKSRDSQRPGKDPKEKGPEAKGKDGKETKAKVDKKAEKDKLAKPIPEAKEETEIKPSHTELVAFAGYEFPSSDPLLVSRLGDAATVGDCLRESGLSFATSHPVLLTQTRDIPLEPPPPEVPVPSWRLIRGKKKRDLFKDSDFEEPKAIEIKKWVEICSPYIGYKVRPFVKPTDTKVHEMRIDKRGDAKAKQRGDDEVVIEINEDPEEILRLEKAYEEEMKARMEAAHTEDVNPSKHGDAKRSKDDKKNSPPGGAKAPKDGKVIDDQKSPKLKPRVAEATPRKDGRPGDAEPQNGQELVPEVADKPEKPDETTSTVAVSCEQETRKLWFDFDKFVQCFTKLYLFHKPSTYKCKQKVTDLKAQGTPQVKDKKAAHAASHATSESKSPMFLFVDSRESAEIVVSFHSLSRWFEIPINPTEGTKGGKPTSHATSLEASQSQAPLSSPPQEYPAPPPGVLTVEPYSWNSTVFNKPLLTLKTTGVKGALLCLPEGRHVLKFTMEAPLGFHVDCLSNTPFTFADEDTVMSLVEKESFRFIDYATRTMKAFGDMIKAFNDDTSFEERDHEFKQMLCPAFDGKPLDNRMPMETFLHAVVTGITAAHGNQVEYPVWFAWKTLTMGLSSTQFHMPVIAAPTNPRPESGPGSGQGSAKEKPQLPAGRKSEADKVIASFDSPPEREPSLEELMSAVKIQASWRGHVTRKMIKAREPGSPLNESAHTTLVNSWSLLENSLETVGLSIFKSIIQKELDQLERYPFSKEEWNFVSFADHQGQYADTPPQTWFMLFRGVFGCSEPTFMLPKVYSGLPTCFVRVIDNDTYQEVPRIFHKITPHYYLPNRNGYTIIAESKSMLEPVAGSKWRLRFLTSFSVLPTIRGELCATFHVREIKDYYIPNRDDVVMRYKVHITEDHLSTIHFVASKSDVCIQLSILDNEREMLELEGIGQIIVPAFVFRRDRTLSDPIVVETAQPEERKKQPSPKPTSTPAADAKKLGDSSKTKPAEKRARRLSTSGADKDGKHDGRQSNDDDERGSLDNTLLDSSHRFADDDEPQAHKFVIQVKVLRKSWPLTPVQWSFVEAQREKERSEMRVTEPDVPAKPTAGAPSKDKISAVKMLGKKGGKGAAKDNKPSRPASNHFESSQAHWVMRFYSDDSTKDEVDLKKDMDRIEEIKATKRAWEDAEPGRAARAAESRKKYIKDHSVRAEDETGDESAASDTEGRFDDPSNDPPVQKQKEFLQPIDTTPFRKNYIGNGQHLHLDEEVKKQLEERRVLEFNRYREWREQILKDREEDKKKRYQEKMKQVETCLHLQERLDAARTAIIEPREVIRQRILEAEKKRQEELAALEAAKEKEKTPKSPKGKKAAAKRK